MCDDTTVLSFIFHGVHVTCGPHPSHGGTSVASAVLFCTVQLTGPRCCVQAGSLRRSSELRSIPPDGTAAAARWRAAVGIDPPATPGLTEDASCATYQPVLAFQRVQELQETHAECLPLLSVLTLPRPPTPEEAAHLDGAPQHASPSAGAIQVPLQYAHVLFQTPIRLNLTFLGFTDRNAVVFKKAFPRCPQYHRTSCQYTLVIHITSFMSWLTWQLIRFVTCLD